MTFLQLFCIQLLLLVVANQILANPSPSDSTDASINTNDNYLSNYENVDQLITAIDNFENLRQNLKNKLYKRRAQAKANLAGLWGVPTRFA